MNRINAIAVVVIAGLSLFAVVQVLDVYAGRGRWDVQAGEEFSLTGFHRFDNGTTEKVDVTCSAQGMPDVNQAVVISCIPLGVYHPVY